MDLCFPLVFLYYLHYLAHIDLVQSAYITNIVKRSAVSNKSVKFAQFDVGDCSFMQVTCV